jgi:copper oxidase (laccase) domain-containing protein
LAKRFERRFAGAHTHIQPGDRPGKSYLDLRAIVAEQLAVTGLERDSIQSIGPCTKCAVDSYFSRRAAGGSVTGLQLSYIGRFVA